MKQFDSPHYASERSRNTTTAAIGALAGIAMLGYGALSDSPPIKFGCLLTGGAIAANAASSNRMARFAAARMQECFEVAAEANIAWMRAIAMPPAASMVPIDGTSTLLLPGIGGEITQAFLDLGIGIQYMGSVEGLTFTRHTLRPAKDLKTGKLATADQIEGKTKDLQLALRAKAEPLISIQGGDIALDIPRADRIFPTYREYMTSDRRVDWESLKMLIGVDPLTREVIEIDFANSDTPHICGGGTSGSGKTEQMRSGILSLVDRYSPECCRILIIDGKGNGFSEFEDSPHLLLPIAKDPAEAIELLSVAVGEQERRYEVFDGVKELAIYNRRAAEKLPRLIIFWDEYANTLDKSSDNQIKEIDRLSQQVGQAGRAAGVQFGAVYTQKPITRTGKYRSGVNTVFWSNLGVNIGFRVKTQPESSVVMGGVEGDANKLLGKEDLLLRTIDGIQRLQGLYIDDPEIIAEAIAQWSEFDEVQPISIPKSEISLPLNKYLAAEAVITSEERSAVLQLWKETQNLNLLCDRIYGIKAGGSPLYEAAKTKIRRIAGIETEPVDGDGLQPLYQAYRIAREQGMDLDEFLIAQRVSDANRKSAKAKIRRAIAAHLPEWVSDLQASQTSKGKAIALIWGLDSSGSGYWVDSDGAFSCKDARAAIAQVWA